MVFRIKDINRGPGNSQPVNFTAIGNRVFFAADPDGTGPELWISDGTEAGTRQVADLSPPPFGGSSPGWSGRAVFGGLYFFAAYNGSSSFLYRSDGLIASLADSTTLNPFSLVATADNLYYAGQSNLWFLDTPLGVPVRIVKPAGAGPFNPFYMTAVGTGNDLFFVDGNDIWRTNGAVTTRVVMPTVPATRLPASPRHLAAVGSTLYFGGSDSAGGYSLWAYNTTALPPPVWLRSFSWYPGQSNPDGRKSPLMLAFGSQLFFVANDGVHGDELWRSNGTPAGTVQVSDIAIGPTSSLPDQFTAAGTSILYFVANDGIWGRELWRTDGTAPGTRRVTDINLGSGNSNPLDLTAVGSRLYFTADDSVNGRQLWVTDLVTDTARRLTSRTMWGSGTEFYVTENSSGTTRNLTVAANTMFMSAYRMLTSPSGPVFEGIELWGLDLTEANKPALLDIIVVNTTALPLPGVRLLLKFSEPIFFDPGAASRFTITVAGVVRPVASIAAGLANELSIILTGPALVGGNVPVEVTYTDPPGNDVINVIEDLAGNDLASFVRNAETFSNDADVTVLHPNYKNLILRGSARQGTANLNANSITVDQIPAVTNVLVGNDLIDFMDGGGGKDIYVVTDPAHHSGGEISDSGAAGDGRDELRFASINPLEQTLVIYSSDVGIEEVAIGTGTGNSPILTGTTPKNIDANLAPNGLSIFGNSGVNRLRGTVFADFINGGLGADVINGGSGNDFINGGSGLDIMDGGAGSDVYIVGTAAEHGAAEVNDTISAGDINELRFTSATNNDTITVFAGDRGLTHVVLSTDQLAPAGTAVRTQTTTLSVNAGAAPNALTILGNDGRNVITGTRFADQLDGAGGDDLFMISDATFHPAGEIIRGGSGTDEIRYSATAPALVGQTLVLSSFITGVERVSIGTGTGATPILTSLDLNVDASAVSNGLTISGNNGANSIRGTQLADVLTGNNGADVLTGNNGNDTLTGGLGRDDLTGGAGADRYLFDAPLVAANRDRIMDFNPGLGDHVALSSAVFIGLPAGALAGTAFTTGTTATTPNHRIIYDRLGSGSLFYDSDGSAAAFTPLEFAVVMPFPLARPILTATDFIVV